MSDPPSETESEIADTAGPPGWFDLLVVGAASFIAALGVVGLALALAGVFRAWAALTAAAMCAVAAVLVSNRGEMRPLWRSRSTVPAVVALVLIAGYTVFVAAVPSQNVIISRDPGSYLNTAVWLAANGGLTVDADSGAFAEVPGLRFAGAAVYETGDGELQFQFNHFTSAVLAAGYDVGGYRLLFRMPALALGVGLLAVYGAAAHAVRRPWLALLAPALLAACAPFLFVGRNTYSEAFALAALWSAVVVLGLVHRRPQFLQGLIGGALLGSTVCVRVDSLLYVALAIPLATLSILSATDRGLRRARSRAWAAAALAAAVVAMVGWVDLTTRSGDYADELGTQLLQLRLLLAGSAGASAVAAVVWSRSDRLRSSARRLQSPGGALLSAVVSIALLAAWLVRPLVQTERKATTNGLVGGIQESLGLEVDSARSYAEHSLWWASWYLGPVALTLGIAGMGLLAGRLVRGRSNPWEAAVVTLGIAAGSLYWWNPSITPDHLWAMRRFVPAVFPALAIAAALVAGVLVDRSGWVGRRSHLGAAPRPLLTAVIGALLAAAMLVPPAWTTWPLRWQRDQYGYLQPILDACRVVGPDGALLVVGLPAGLTLPQTLRSWCGVPVAAQGDAFGRELPRATVLSIAQRVEDQGRQLYLVSQRSSDLTGFISDQGPQPVATARAVDRWSVVPTLTGPPVRLRGDSDDATAAPNPFGLHVLRVEGDPVDRVGP